MCVSILCVCVCVLVSVCVCVCTVKRIILGMVLDIGLLAFTRPAKCWCVLTSLSPIPLNEQDHIPAVSDFFFLHACPDVCWVFMY